MVFIDTALRLSEMANLRLFTDDQMGDIDMDEGF
jgi:hypothetical protein